MSAIGAMRRLIGSGPGASLAIAGSHGLRMVANLVVIKLIATTLGATGLGILGNVMSMTTILSVFAGGGISTAVAKYVAEYRAHPLRLVRFLGSAIVYGLIFSGCLLVASLFGAAPLSRLLFATSVYWWLFPVAAVVQFLLLASLLAIGLVNGLGRTDLFAAITIPAYLGILPISYVLIREFGMAGAAIALLLSVAGTGVTGLIVIARSRLFQLIKLRINRRDAVNLGKFSLMLAASAAAMPVGEVVIRGLITSAMGHEQAGLWQALIRLSGAYLGFFNVALATQYMPMLSSLRGTSAISKAISSALIRVALLFAAFAVVIYFSRALVVTILFSPAFLPIADVMPIQLIGDAFRVLAYVIGFLAVAKGATKLYIIGEAVQMGLWVGLSFIAILIKDDIRAISVAYCISYIIYFAAVAVIALRYRAKSS